MTKVPSSAPSLSASICSVCDEPEHVMYCRGGSVLGKKTILKSDHFPGCQNKCLTPQIEGAPNYRQAGFLRVHGVAIPTIDGIRNVLNHIGAKEIHTQKRVLWHNLREEPVVYINGRPFVLRDVERPFSNLEYTVYEELQLEGYPVDCERVPKECDFHNLICRISQADIDTEIVFNCQMWRGRTTTGMVIATLVYLNRIGICGTNFIGEVDSGADVTDNTINSEAVIRRGEYAVIRSLIRVLEGGAEGKRQVDEVIDQCDSICKLLRRDPMGGLGYSSQKPYLVHITESADGCPHEMGVVAELRDGEVLGSQTVLKSDHCPGLERVDGAPNFREVLGFPVYGVANLTVDGIRAVIKRISCTEGGRPVLWHNMREEPVIYI